MSTRVSIAGTMRGEASDWMLPREYAADVLLARAWKVPWNIGNPGALGDTPLLVSAVVQTPELWSGSGDGTKRELG